MNGTQLGSRIVDALDIIVGWATGRTPVGAVVTLAQQHVQQTAPADTNENALFACVVPPLNPNDSVRITGIIAAVNNANVKTLKVKFGAAILSVPLTSMDGTRFTATFSNKTQATQVGHAYFGPYLTAAGAGNVGVTIAGTVDTSAATALSMTIQKATAGDAITLEDAVVELVRGT